MQSVEDNFLRHDAAVFFRDPLNCFGLPPYCWVALVILELTTPANAGQAFSLMLWCGLLFYALQLTTLGLRHPAVDFHVSRKFS